MITESEYFTIRTQLLDNQADLLLVEQKYMQLLLDAITSKLENIDDDLAKITELLQFWINYAPKQRGRSPTGTAIPWGDAGEKTMIAWLVRAVAEKYPSITHPGLPSGSDMRFATDDALIHFDIKLTGPNDNANEVVASPNQVSGDGRYWSNGIVNTTIKVTGRRVLMDFQPQLPPFYVLRGKILLCLTYFLKVVYSVRSLGDQPLHSLELLCVPNGLLMFDGPRYDQTPNLLIPGKDIQDKASKRVRVRLDPLAKLAGWRCIKLKQTPTGWVIHPRTSTENLP